VGGSPPPPGRAGGWPRGGAANAAVRGGGAAAVRRRCAAPARATHAGAGRPNGVRRQTQRRPLPLGRPPLTWSPRGERGGSRRPARQPIRRPAGCDTPTSEPTPRRSGGWDVRGVGHPPQHRPSPRLATWWRLAARRRQLRAGRRQWNPPPPHPPIFAIKPRFFPRRHRCAGRPHPGETRHTWRTRQWLRRQHARTQSSSVREQSPPPTCR